MKEFATKYNAVGCSCLPCKQDKSPFVSGTWNRLFKPDEFVNAPAIGVKCGRESGNLECIDIDNHQGTAKQNLTEFIEQIKVLYDKYKFPIEQTQNGGYHFLYRCEFIEGNKKIAQVPFYDEAVKKFRPDAIFETRGEGGYFCAYPTPGYVVVKNDIFTIPTITKAERKTIIEIAESFNTWFEPVKNEYEETEKPGDIYNRSFDAITEMKDLLTGAGWTEMSKNQWCRPGKKNSVSATLGKVADNVFYPFTANGYPFEPRKGYSPFQVLGLLKFNGDFKEAAKYIVDRMGLESKPKTGQKTKQEDTKPIIKTDEEKFNRLKKAFIDTDIEIEKPPVILYINDDSKHESVRKRLFTLGNFSAIIGKAKSRKTFNLTMLTAAVINNNNIYNKFFARLPHNKTQVLYFDTEQGLYDSANTIKRMERLSNNQNGNFVGFNIREYTPLERCEIIEDALQMYPGVGFVAIDGIADLAKAINDEEEATRVTGLLLRWTKQYNCHICTILHQNKNDNFATGHLGSSVMKKAEIVMSVAKEQGSESDSVVSCDYSRGIDFKDYKFFVNGNGLPELCQYTLEESPVSKWYD